MSLLALLAAADDPTPIGIPVTATGPTWTDNPIGGGTWTTPSQTGVTYSPASGAASPGQVVSVTATAQEGYVLQGTTSWTHTFPVAVGYLHPNVTATRVRTTASTTENAMSEDITKVGSTYWLLYTNWGDGGITRLHLASSSSADGPWTTYPGNPILTCGSGGPNPLPWESSYTNGGSIILYEGTFYLYYSDDGTGGAISVATASAITGPYTKHGSILVDVDPDPAAWDSRRVQEPHVIIAPDGTWVMAYMAETMDKPQGQSEQCAIATAPGPLGPWTKSPNNPLVGFGAPGTWDVGGTADPSLFYEPETGLYWMLYSGLTGPTGGTPWWLGLAYAEDVHGPWTRIPTNPILAGSGSGFDANSVWRGSIFKESGVYHLPYGGFSGGPSGALGGAARINI